MPILTADHRAAAAHVATLIELKSTPRPWTVYETFFYNTLRRVLAAEALRLALHILDVGPDGAVNAAWFLAHQGELLDVLANSLEDVARFGVLAGRQALTAPITVNWNLVNSRAVDWAHTNAAELVKGITETTRQNVSEAVSDWVASGQPTSALARTIQGLDAAFGPKRALLIAQTESTNSFAHGNVMAWAAAGLPRVVFPPSAHPRCRCRIQPKQLPDGTTGVIWMTVEDELVCDQPIDTPWGTVDGCADLDNTIVSEGSYLGQHV